MSEAEHVEYYRGRAATERELAASAPNTKISRLHSEMAAYYEKLVRQPERRNELNIVTDPSGPETNRILPLSRLQARQLLIGQAGT